MKIYVASSWRNAHQPEIVRTLRSNGHEVYDFREPRPGESGFAWSDIDPRWQSWGPSAFREALRHPIADHGFGRDLMAMQWADACVLVLPCGRSAHLEAGWFTGRRKPLHVLLTDGEPELMYKLTPIERIHTDMPELLQGLTDDAQPYDAKIRACFREACRANARAGEESGASAADVTRRMAERGWLSQFDTVLDIADKMPEALAAEVA